MAWERFASCTDRMNGMFLKESIGHASLEHATVVGLQLSSYLQGT
jgi:hypothetical protein